MAYGAHMQNDLDPERVAQLSKAVLANFGALSDESVLQGSQALKDFAQSNAITISYAHFYLVIGALNFPKLDDGRMMFAGITPVQAAKLLNSNPKKMRRLLGNLAEKGLLGRDVSGTYKIADIDLWFQLSKAATLAA